MGLRSVRLGVVDVGRFWASHHAFGASFNVRVQGLKRGFDSRDWRALGFRAQGLGLRV